MKTVAEGLDFESVIDGDGRIGVPEEILRRLGAQAGSRVRVRLMPAVIAAALARKNVTTEEVDLIASVQLESQANVISFLLAEGALATGRRKPQRTKGRRK
jgi:bifunctional DNA-binding transcriptional regulator/antitoxin component of YhaV-PrlF toxin-antitoxin module